KEAPPRDSPTRRQPAAFPREVSMIPCLTPAQFQGLLSQQLSERQRKALDVHIDTCPGCQETLARLLDDGEAEDLGPDWRRLCRADGETTPRSLEGFLCHLKDQLRPSRMTAAGPRNEATPCDIRFPEPPTPVGPLGRLESYHIVAERGRGAFGIVFQAY